MVRSLLAVACFWCGGLAVSGACGAEGPSPQPAPSASRAAYSLFDGKTLNGWTIENGCQVTVDNGTILLKGGNGWLRSDHTYGDFALHVEWKAEKKADYDSGIYVRTLPPGSPFPRRSYQINLLQGQEGALKALPKAVVPAGLVRPGEWNAFDVTVVGNTIELQINGKPAYKAVGLKHPRGYIGLQCEVIKGGEFRFRNLHVVEFDHEPLFNGRDFAGWTGVEGSAEKCWKVDQGTLLCTGEKGPWLRTAKQYGDFNLRLEYRLSPGGNSGLFVRVPADGLHHRPNTDAPPAGFEVQILDDRAKEYAKLKDYQYTASIYDIVGAHPRVGRQPGEWNSLEINCRGQQIAITHNGTNVVQATGEKYPLLNWRQTSGYLGLQNHSTPVSFRNIRLGPAQ